MARKPMLAKEISKMRRTIPPQECRAGYEGNTLNSKNLYPTSLFNISHIVDPWKLIAGLPAAQPEFDAIAVSVRSDCSPGEVKQKFANFFGKPRLNEKKDYWIFSNGIRLSVINTHFHHTVICPSLDLVAVLLPVLESFPARRNGKAPSFTLTAAEVKFDIPLPGVSDNDIEKVLHAIATISLPRKHPYACLYIHHGNGEKKHTWDGAINGEKTYYMSPLMKKEYIAPPEQAGWLFTLYGTVDDGIFARPDRNGGHYTLIPDTDTKRHSKIYAKKFDKNGSWYIRFEVTLVRSGINKIGGQKTTLEELANLSDSNRLSGLRFSDFWKLETFDLAKFLKKAHKELANYKGSRQLGIRTRLMAKELGFQDGFNKHYPYAIRQKQFARLIADMLGSASLRERLDKNGYSTRLL